MSDSDGVVVRLYVSVFMCCDLYSKVMFCI